MQDISSIKGVGEKTVQTLKSGDITSVEELADTDIETLTDLGMSEKRARKFRSKAKENTINIQMAADRQEEFNNRETIPTGIDELNNMVNGGFEEQELIAAYGGSGSGKTQVGLQSIVNAVESTGDPAVYIETERDRFRPKRVLQMAESDDILDKIAVVRAYNLEDQLNSYGKVMEAFDELSLLVVDSFTAQFRLEEEFEGRSNLGKRSVEFRKHLNKLEEVVEALNCPIYLSCQVSSNPERYKKDEFIYGATIFIHMATYFLHMSAGTGDLRAIELENHPAEPNDEIEINITEGGIIGMETQ